MKLLALMVIPTLFKVKKSPKRTAPSFLWFSYTMANNILVIRIGMPKMLKYPSRPWNCCWFALTASPTHIKCQQGLKRPYPLFRRFSYAITQLFVGDLNFDVKMPQKFLDVRQDLGYATGWSSPWVWPIFNVKRVFMRAFPSYWWFLCTIAHNFLNDPDSDVKSAKKLFCGRSSRTCLCSWFSLATSMTHYEGQTVLEKRIPTILIIFMYYSIEFFQWSGFWRAKC